MGTWTFETLWTYFIFIAISMPKFAHARLNLFQQLVRANPSQDPDLINFYLLNNTYHGRQIIYNDVGSITHSGYVRSAKLRLFIHGFTRNPKNGGCYPLGHAFVKIEKRPKFKWNTICVDWEELGSPNTTLITSTGSTVNTVHKLLYFPAIVLSAKITGKRIADFLIFLMKQKALKSYDDVHLIGISLGAHVAGTAGYWIKKKTGKMLGRITGLDPSGPLTDQGLIPVRYILDKTKAQYVDVIHTDFGFLGTKKLAGHVDFFANGGRTGDQRHCGYLNITNVFRGCGHALSLEYYERVVLGEEMLGCRCKFNAKLASAANQPCLKRNCKATTPFGLDKKLSKSEYGTYFIDIPLVPARKVQDAFLEFPLEILLDLNAILYQVGLSS